MVVGASYARHSQANALSFCFTLFSTPRESSSADVTINLNAGKRAHSLSVAGKPANPPASPPFLVCPLMRPAFPPPLPPLGCGFSKGLSPPFLSISAAPFFLCLRGFREEDHPELDTPPDLADINYFIRMAQKRTHSYHSCNVPQREAAFRLQTSGDESCAVRGGFRRSERALPASKTLD